VLAGLRRAVIVAAQLDLARGRDDALARSREIGEVF
jgi:hypothetical protein